MASFAFNEELLSKLGLPAHKCTHTHQPWQHTLQYTAPPITTKHCLMMIRWSPTTRSRTAPAHASGFRFFVLIMFLLFFIFGVYFLALKPKSNFLFSISNHHDSCVPASLRSCCIKVIAPSFSAAPTRSDYPGMCVCVCVERGGKVGKVGLLNKKRD